MLTQENKEYFKKMLTNRLDEILGKAQRTVIDIKEYKDKLSDLMDQASMEYDVSFALRIRGREEKLIRKIKGALERLEDGTFGVCEACEEDISVKRLMARPVTTLCIECKEDQESYERPRSISMSSY